MLDDKLYLINLLCKLVEIESPTCFENNIANFISGIMKDIGFTKIYTDKNFNVVGELKASNPGKTLLFLTNLDSSPIDVKQNPLKAELIDRVSIGEKRMIIEGPGTAAPKSSIAAILEATRRLSRRRNEWKGCIKIAMVTKDLKANHDGPREVSLLIKDADFAITGEPSNNNVVISARGILHIMVTIFGKSTHWSIPEVKNNVFYKLCNFLEGLKKIPILEDNQFGPTGFNPIKIEIQDFPPFLPKSLNLIIDRRILPEESIDKIYNQIKSLGDEIGDDQLKIEIIRKMYPFQAQNVNQEKKILKNVIRTVTGKKAKETIIHFASNSSYLNHELNIPSLVIGPGNLEHSGINECIEVESLENASNIYYNFALKYLS